MTENIIYPSLTRMRAGLLLMREGVNRPTLDEFNKAMLEARKELEQPENGVFCPECGTELHDRYRNVAMATCPPSTPIYCPKCGFEGMRYV